MLYPEAVQLLARPNVQGLASSSQALRRLCSDCQFFKKNYVIGIFRRVTNPIAAVFSKKNES